MFGSLAMTAKKQPFQELAVESVRDVARHVARGERAKKVERTHLRWKLTWMERWKSMNNHDFGAGVFMRRLDILDVAFAFAE